MKSYNELVKPVKFINFEDLCELIGVKRSIREFPFTTGADNDTYVSFGCDDQTLEELIDTLDRCDDSCYLREYHGKNWRQQYENQIKLIETLRKQYGIMDDVLTYISW